MNPKIQKIVYEYFIHEALESYRCKYRCNGIGLPLAEVLPGEHGDYQVNGIREVRELSQHITDYLIANVSEAESLLGQGVLQEESKSLYPDVPIFDTDQAIQAQLAYSKRINSVHFAPITGICWYCKFQIYTKISVQEAATRIITHCPYCNQTYAIA